MLQIGSINILLRVNIFIIISRELIKKLKIKNNYRFRLSKINNTNPETITIAPIKKSKAIT